MPVEGRTHRPVITHEKCNQCKVCRLFCPDLAITLSESEGRIVIDLGYCKGCAICVEFCPREAIEMELEQ
jgi:2-oxoacid:acceptor oxidoreductase delta subunit (pyruvate/2-ketoisovalerate family)